MNKNKVMSMMLALVMIFNVSAPAFAESIDDRRIDSKDKTSIITNKDELQRIINEDDIEIPEGYKLLDVVDSIEEISVDFSKDSLELMQNSASTSNFDEVSQTRWFWFWDDWKVKNRQYLGEYYFPGNPLRSDYFEGPCDISETYTEQVKAEVHTGVNVGNDVLGAELGVSLAQEESVSTHFKTSVPSGIELNVIIYGMYKKYSYDIYKNGYYRGTGTLYVPSGLYARQLRYYK